jgi:6-phosphofructokinase 2
MIVTITMNPALDKSTSVDTLAPEHKLRCAAPVCEPGGGGINVSKAIQKLGGHTRCIYTAGGYNGKLLGDLLHAQGIEAHAISTTQETRENFIVLETSTNNQYRFGMPGEADASCAADCLSFLQQLHPTPQFIVASGSLPTGINNRFYADLADVSKQLGAKYILDTSGPALQAAAGAGLYLLKPNINELCRLLDVEKLELGEVDEAAQELIRRGHCEVVVVSLGAAGALLVTAAMHEHFPAPPVKKRSTVGAGDSMVGGMVWMLQQGAGLREVVRFGVACGTAATMNAGTQLFKKDDVERLYAWMKKP